MLRPDEAKVVVVSRTPFRIDETAALLRSGTLSVEVPVLMRTSNAGNPIPSPRHNLAAPESLPVTTKDELRQLVEDFRDGNLMISVGLGPSRLTARPCL